MSRVLVALVLVAGLSIASEAHAYRSGQSFARSANEGGGGGIFFTGAGRWKGYDCTICHTDTPGAASIEMTSEPPDLMQGRWQAGETYQLRVVLKGESKGVGNERNVNSFYADVSDAKGMSVGALLVDDTAFESWSNGVVGSLAEDNRSEWQLQFRAPASGNGTITLNIAALDGDGTDPESGRGSDVQGDDVALLSLRLCENGSACSEAGSDAGDDDGNQSPVVGCSTGGSGSSWLLLLVLMIMFRARRQTAGRQ